AVTTILEQSINGVEGMRYMSSTSSNDGTSSITVTFDTGYDLNIAAVDVQNRVASVQGRLPSVVNNTGISITKSNPNFVLAVEVAAGQLGQQPSDPHQQFQMAVRVVGRLTDPRQFDNIVLKNSTNSSGGIVLVKDVGRAQIGAENYNTSLKFSGGGYEGGDAIGVGILQLSNANALDVDKRCRAVLAELEKSYPPGLQGVIAVDTTLVIGESVHEVVTTIGQAIVIVILVIFLFLQDWRATIIPAVTIPVSLIGTFAFIKIFGFSINSLTLFGITLATGLVVDDAIVVIENVQRHLSRTALIPERSE